MTTDIASSIDCAICLNPITETELKTCPHCQRGYHRACWETHGGCQTAGCCGPTQIAPPVEAEASELPPITSLPAAPNEAQHWIIIGAVIAVLILAAIIAIHFGVKLDAVLVISVVIAALTFDYVNGMHDAGNAIATVISTRVLTPAAALTMAAVMNLFGALIHAGVAASIATKFTTPDNPIPITPLMILCGLVGASAWSYLTARWGLPVSTSHSLIGGLIGVFLLGGIQLNLEYLGKIGLFMVVAPITAFVVGWGLMVSMMWIFRKMAPHKINQHFRIWQMLSSALMAFSHGSNDAQKAMGIITMALVSGGFLTVAKDAPIEIPLWVKIACALVIALGTGFGGMRVIKTLGHKIIKMAPVHGFAAETVAAATIQLVTFMHVPISTTHVISSSILGIGASKRLSAVRWGVASNIVAAWIFTIPTCAVAGAVLYAVVRFITGVH